MFFVRSFNRVLAVLLTVAILSPVLATSATRRGVVELTRRNLQPGASIDLNGEWFYRPGYDIPSNSQPQFAIAPNAVRVPVPQLLNRIHWWLDDSEDFKRYETERLKRLGFDTDRAEDGWYYLRLNLPELPASTRIAIEFEGVAMISRTYCNGHLLGEHKGMFSRFSYDLTPHLKTGDNIIAVFVSMEKIRPSTLSMGEAVTVNLTASKVRTMSKGMFGPLSPNFDNRAYDLHGIWQPVKLVVRNGAKLDDVWFKPALTGADVQIETKSLTSPTAARLSAKWTDAESGRTFAEIESRAIQLTTNTTTHHLTLTNVAPKLWTPSDPNLYRLEVRLESTDGALLDSWSQNVGFRTFEIRGNQFYLNGKPYWLRGANHLPYGKNPFDPALARKLIQYLYDANVRITRTHATPWNEAWLDAADEIGLAVSLEGIRPWALAGKIGATPPDLFAHWLMENEDVVKRARNHPSVFIYTVGNEMLLRDTRNLEKWQQLSEVVKQTRQVDPTRPVICSSEYTREPELYNELIKPNGIDDGDADDLHRYNNWYGPSSFVTDAKFEREAKINGGTRPMIGQEMSSGYPDLDTGLPVLRYTRDLVTPQAWVGNFSYPGNDAKHFLEHHRAVTKRWAERLRFERGTNTAGFMLFATECWFSHSYDARTATPYPVVESMREAYAAVGVALESGRRRFFSGEKFETAVFITNDDERQRNFTELELRVEFFDRNTRERLQTAEIAGLNNLAFRQTSHVPVTITIPMVTSRRELGMRLRLSSNRSDISRSTDYIDVWRAPQLVVPDAPVFIRHVGPDLREFLQTTLRANVRPTLEESRVVMLGSEDDLAGLEPGGALRKTIEAGATAIVFSPGEKFTAMFTTDVGEGRVAPGEYADFSPCAGTPLVQGLSPMDLKWWGRKDDWRVFVADTSHRLRTKTRARELIRFIPAHSYIAADKVPEQYRTVMFEIPLGRGRLWGCDLDIEASLNVDPAARQFMINLLRAAADTNSTAELPRVPSHQELLNASTKRTP